MTATKLTACFIDDLGQATPAVQAAAMQLILALTLNGHRVSDQVVFVAATNRRTDPGRRLRNPGAGQEPLRDAG